MRTYTTKKGFSLIEVIIVIVIVGYLSSVVLGAVRSAQNKAYYVRGQKELNSIHESLQLYLGEHNSVYPAEVTRGLPSELDAYLPSGTLPAAPWPNTVYDWDVWDDPLSSKDIIQISIRFCPVGGDLSTCNFPNDAWAKDFNINSCTILLYTRCL